jgi:hypothetical protein
MLLSSISIIAAVLAGLRAAVSHTDWQQSRRIATLRMATVLLPLWFAAAVALSYAGAFRGAPSSPPTVEFGIFVPIIIALVWLWRSPAAMRLLDAVPQSWLVGLQFYRVLGAIFLVMYAQGRMPAAFALPAGAGDVAVGLLAPIVAVVYARGFAGARAFGRWLEPARPRRSRQRYHLRLPDVAVAASAAVIRCTEPADHRISAGVSASVRSGARHHPARGIAHQAQPIADWRISNQSGVGARTAALRAWACTGLDPSDAQRMQPRAHASQQWQRTPAVNDRHNSSSFTTEIRHQDKDVSPSHILKAELGCRSSARPSQTGHVLCHAESRGIIGPNSDATFRQNDAALPFKIFSQNFPSLVEILVALAASSNQRAP